MGTKRQAWAWGLLAERICVWILRLKGYRILAQRFKTHVGEIDIVAQKGNLVSFIEVKARPNQRIGLECISSKQQQRIYHAAQIFLSKSLKKDFDRFRFDVMVVVPWCWPYHLKDAWRIQ